jgi:Pyruvate/2-oxoacid:ferredoxin oxidoreductase delta subunit
MTGVKATDMYLGCGKKLKKSETSVQCTVCSLWCHKECAAISNEFLKFLEEQKKNTGLAYWACRPCTLYAQGMKHRLREMEKRLDSVEEANKKNDNNISQVKKKVEKLRGRWRTE